MRFVSEGYCPLCKVRLAIHDGRACCPCCGDSYLTDSNNLEIRRCSLHGRDCEHWHTIWNSRAGAQVQDASLMRRREGTARSHSIDVRFLSSPLLGPDTRLLEPALTLGGEEVLHQQADGMRY